MNDDMDDNISDDMNDNTSDDMNNDMNDDDLWFDFNILFQMLDNVGSPQISDGMVLPSVARTGKKEYWDGTGRGWDRLHVQ